MIGEAMLVLITLIGSFVVGAAIMAYIALILTVMWGWFITPTFGIVAPSVLAMFGILMMWGVARPGDLSKTRDWDEIFKMTMLRLFLATATWGVAWIAHKMF